MLINIGPEIWLADGPRVTAALGFCYPTRMAILCLPGRRLFIWSPVALTDATRVALAGLGTVSHVIAPNSLHDSFLSEWHTAYPEAAFHAAPNLSAARPDIAFNTELTALPDPGWQGHIEQVVVPGNVITTEVVFFHRASGTILFTDLLQHLPGGWFTGWRGLVAKLDFLTQSEPAVPRKFRLAFRDRRAARVAIAQVLNWPVRQVVMAHGEPVTRDAAGYLRRAFAWLRPGK